MKFAATITTIALVAGLSLGMAIPATALEAAACQSGFTSNSNPCFEFEGDYWVVTNPELKGTPISRIAMTPGFKQFCPQLTVKVERVKNNAGGHQMTKKQKFRDDFRTHVVCDRSAPIPRQAVTPTPLPPQTPAVAPRDQSGINPNGTINVRALFHRI